MNIFFYYIHPSACLKLSVPFLLFHLVPFFPPSEYIWANCLLLIEAFTAFSVLLLLLLRVEKNA